MASDDDTHVEPDFESVHPEQHEVNRLIQYLSIAIAILHIYLNMWGDMSELRFTAVHFGSLGLLCALSFPLAHSADKRLDMAIRVTDILLGLAAIACVVYLFLMEVPLYERGTNFIFTDWVFSILAVTLVLEFTRRTMGWFIPVCTIISILYVTWLGKYFSGMLHFPGLSLETIMYRTYFTADSMFGPMALISATYIFMFIMFGSFLLKSGAGDFMITLARSVAGRVTGGAGMVAVMGSMLMGMISGSAIANVVSVGSITIPLMIRSGYNPIFAAAVETAASTGGQMMPPIMGAGAFIMASYTQIPYTTIAFVSFLPASLYFLSVAIWVRIEAKRRGLIEQNIESLPPIWPTIRKNLHFLLPVVMITALLMYGFTPIYAAGLSIISIIVSSWFTDKPMKVKEILDSLQDGVQNLLSTGLLLVSVGIVVNIVMTTGIGNTFSLMIVDWAHGDLLLMLIFIALASMILGLGLPVTASYIILATLAASGMYELIAKRYLIEALANGTVLEQAKLFIGMISPENMNLVGTQMGIEKAKEIVALVPQSAMGTLLDQSLSPETLLMALLSAHMIIFWLSQDGNITPPVCLTAFAAATIAKTPPMKTGFMSWKVAKGLYIVPILFAYTPILGNDFLLSFEIFVVGMFGIYGTISAMQGYMEGPLNIFWRAVAMVCGLALLFPSGRILNLAGLLGLAITLLISHRAAKTQPAVQMDSKF